MNRIRPRRTTRTQALKGTEALTRPEGIGVTLWHGVKPFLMVIARHYPDPWPSQETIAKEMGVAPRTVQKYTRVALDAGLLMVKPQEQGEHGHWYSNRYRLPYLHMDQCPTDEAHERAARPSARSCGLSTSSSKSYPVQNSSSKSSSTNRSSPAASASMATLGDDSHDPVEEEPSPPPKVSRGGGKNPKLDKDGNLLRSPGRDPAGRLVNQFLDGWAEMVETRWDYRDLRPFDTIEQMRGYLRDTFLDPDAKVHRSEAEVAVMITGFLAAVRSGDTMVKTGQSGWKRFTGWWNRQDSYQDTPEAQRRRLDKWR